jgi:hypothetical protein
MNEGTQVVLGFVVVIVVLFALVLKLASQD